LPILHYELILLGLVIAFYSYLQKFKIVRPPEGFHPSWELVVGFLLLATGFAVPWLARRLLRRIVSVRLDTSRTPALRPPSSAMLQTAIVRTDEDIVRLVRFFEEVYPYFYVTGIPTKARGKTYKKWLVHCPGFARLILQLVPREPAKIVGFTVVLRMDYGTYVRYRNGEGDPQTWDGRFLLPREIEGAPFLYLQAFYCSHAGGPQAPRYLFTHLLGHLRYFAAYPDSQPPVIFSPARAPQSIENLKNLGFEQARISRGGFEIWELDCRRIQELSSAAQSTYSALCTAPTMVEKKPFTSAF
jgi:hypothetical protein